MAGEGMRVLGLAFKVIDDDTAASWDTLTWVGLVGLIDPIRPGVQAAIAICHQAGIRAVMITGDQGLTAVAVGRTLGLLREGHVRVLEAGELARLDANTMRGVVREVDVFARVAPAQKYEIVRALQAGGDIVAMTGDGVNDGPALKAADIGVAMGQRGTEMARDLADVILMDDDFGSIVAAVEDGRTLRANLQKALRFLVATNLAEVIVTFGAMLVGGAQPLSALHLCGSTWSPTSSRPWPWGWSRRSRRHAPTASRARCAAPVPRRPGDDGRRRRRHGRDDTRGLRRCPEAVGRQPRRLDGRVLDPQRRPAPVRAGVPLRRALRPRGLGGNRHAGRRRRWHADAAGRHRDRASAPRAARTTPLGMVDLAVIGAGATVPLVVRETIKALERSGRTS